MSERRIYNPALAPPWNPAKDWVELSEGASVCVWELSVPESYQVAEAAQRHPQDPRPGGNEQEAAIWLLAYSCRKGDEPGSERIWSDLEAHRVMDLPPADFTRLLLAARGLLEAAPAAEERQRDFTLPPPDTSGPRSPIGVSSSSTDSR